ncbi:iron-hydroxamate ABC transporter substrate-binding protein [Brevibacillus reuszeri]|uniref:iron-hydroxamate ABC transporter substrate-binding protein n=1 Tax=Brevibacillus reuszeri TaxID=54915 RepID=UPI0035E3D09D
MKRLGFIVFLLFLTGLLAACGKPNTDSASSQTQAKTTATTASLAAEMITYKAANGEVLIPKKPQRVVILADVYFGHFVTLGFKPVAATDYVFNNPFYKGLLDGVENVSDGTSLEKILDMKPDLIIAYNPNDLAGELAKIAPTVLVNFGEKDTKELLKEFGRMTGTEEKAEAWIAQWNKKIAEAKPKVVEKVGTKTVSILQPTQKELYVYGNSFGRGGDIMYDEFGLKAPASTQKDAIDSKVGWVQISAEKIPEYAGDYVFTAPWTKDLDGKFVYDSVLWKNLPAYKNNHMYSFDPVGFYFNDPISMDGQLDFVIKSLME